MRVSFSPRAVGSLVIALGIGVAFLAVPSGAPAVLAGGAVVVAVGAFIRQHRHGWRVARLVGAFGLLVVLGLLALTQVMLSTGQPGQTPAAVVTVIAVAVGLLSVAALRTTPVPS